MRDKIYQLFLKFLSIIPIDKKLVLFESHDDFTDSSKQLFDKVPKSYKAAWVVYDLPKAKKEKPAIKCYAINLKNKNYLSFLRGQIAQTRAGVVFYTHRNIGNPYKTNQKRIFITHAAPPVKNSKGFFWDYDFNTAILSTSNFSGEYRCKTLGGGLERLVITGLPRNDLLFSSDKKVIRRRLKVTTDKMIVWMPTFKQHKNKTRSDFGKKNDNDISLMTPETLDAIQNELAKRNILLVIKPHPAQDMDVFKAKRSANIAVMTNDDLKKMGVEPYELLASCDALITDFSSVYFDYLLCDKPIAFELCDKEKYEKGIGFIFENPLDFMPGNKIYRINDFCDFIEDVAKGRDRFKNERRALLRRSHKYIDGNSTQRVIETFLQKND